MECLHLKYKSLPKDFSSDWNSMFLNYRPSTDPVFFENHATRIYSSALKVRFLPFKYHLHFNVPYFFQFFRKIQVFILLFSFFPFYLEVSRNANSSSLKDHFFCWLSLGLVVWPREGDPFVSQNPREFGSSHFHWGISGYACTICFVVTFKRLTQFPVDHFAQPDVSSLLFSLC